MKNGLKIKDHILDEYLEAYDIVDEDGLFIYANKAYLKMWGYETMDEIIGTSPALHCLDAEMPKEIIAKVNKDGWGEFEFKAKRKDNSVFDVFMRVSLFTDEHGKKYYHSFSRDITQKKKQDAELEKYRNHLEELVEEKIAELKESAELLKRTESITHIGSWDWDIENDVITWSDEMFRIFGLDKKNGVPGYFKGHSKFFTENSQKIMGNAVTKAIESGEPYEIELSVRKSNKLIKVYGFPKRNKAGKVKSLYGSIQDITEEKERERLLIEAINKAQASDELKTAFLANLSHEIRTPMNAIIGFTNLLKNDHLPKKKKHEFLGIVEDSSKQLLHLIEDILEFSKIDTGQAEIKYTSINFCDLFKKTKLKFDEIKKSQKKDAISIELNIPKDCENLYVKTDPVRIEQILNNLIENALKYSKDGTIQFGYELIDDENIQILVKDEGIGIEKDKIGLIFDRFIQIKSNPDFNYEGTGLGLSIVKGLVDLLEGEIEVESEVGKGSTFKLTLPLLATSSISNKKSKNDVVDCNFIKHLTILVVDDELYNRKFLEEILSSHTKEFFTASNGIEAIEVVMKNQNIDFILMDIKMPRMDGFQVAEEILKINPKAKIIAQTAYVTLLESERFTNSGFIDYISKPINLDDLLAIFLKFGS